MGQSKPAAAAAADGGGGGSGETKAGDGKRRSRKRRRTSSKSSWLSRHVGDLKHVKGVAIVIRECEERSERHRAGLGVQVQGEADPQRRRFHVVRLVKL